MPDDGLYRAGRWRDVVTYPDPTPRTSFTRPILDGYRWEDAIGRFSTAKCSATAEGAIGRTIARYRKRVLPDGTGLINAIIEFMSEPPDEGEPQLVEGVIPEDIFDDLYVIHIPNQPEVLFVDLEHPSTLDSLETLLTPVIGAMGLPERLRGNLAREEDRRLTRLVMTALYGECEEPVAGIRYAGQPDPEWEAYVLWCPPELIDLEGDDVELRWVARWDEALLAAAEKLDLQVP